MKLAYFRGGYAALELNLDNKHIYVEWLYAFKYLLDHQNEHNQNGAPDQ